ncbi:MAG: KamA family radical SAM protein, partial [Deltaproteobacteria bacterium]|nr:KamA family radical SAM protein [Deltaproteobacteria bacterium]
MHIKKQREKLINILSHAPELKEIFISGATLEKKRNRIRQFISNTLVTLFEDNPDIPSLEWVLMHDVVRVWKNLCSIRNEKLTGHSLLKYMNDLLHSDDPESLETPLPGFFAEIDHLVKGVTGTTEVYQESIPAFLKYKGRKAARYRSSDLSRMARKAKKKIDRYPCGLDDNAIQRRSLNKARIMKYFKATDLEWEKWKWHAGNVIRDAETLSKLVEITDEEYAAVKLASEYKIAFGITPYYLSLMDNTANGKTDAAIRAQVIPSMHYVKKLKEQKDEPESFMDFMLEHDTSPIDGVTRRYPNIVILKPILTCPQICVYCQRNWEIEDTYSRSAVLVRDKLDKAIEWIENTPEINEVLITGGDPMLLSNKRLEYILSQVAKNPNIKRIRIGTRTPVTLPQRITDTIVKAVNRFHIPGKREMVIITHFEHP